MNKGYMTADNYYYENTEPFQPEDQEVPLRASPVEYQIFQDGQWVFNKLKYQFDKVDELNSICDETIYGGFVANNGHRYSYKLNDQNNFGQYAMALTLRPDIQTLIWKTEDVGPIQHDRTEWIAVYMNSLQHKENVIHYYWGLKSMIYNAQTKEEIDAIQWNYIPQTL